MKFVNGEYEVIERVSGIPVGHIIKPKNKICTIPCNNKKICRGSIGVNCINGLLNNNIVKEITHKYYFLEYGGG